MFKNRIELESSEEVSRRYQKLLEERQRAFEFFWDLKLVFGGRLFEGITESAEEVLASSNIEEIGRRRFFRIVGGIKIPLMPIKH